MKRIEYLDLLRVIAIFGVIVVHISAQNWYSTDIHSMEWHVFNIWDSIFRCSVPVFVMISGVLFLSKEIEIKKLYSKNILRIITAFAFWSLLYVLILDNSNKIEDKIMAFYLGHYHMWFAFMIVLLYMLTPVLKKIIEDKKIIEYFLIIYFVFQTILPQISTFIYMLNHKTMAIIMNKNMDKFQINFGYIGYFVLGYYLSKKDLSKKWRIKFF